MSEHRETAQVDPQVTLSGPPEGGDPSRAVVTGRPEPTPQELNEQLSDGAGAAVSTQPSDEHPGDLDDARTRAGWDESTDDGAGLDEAERGQ